MRDSAGASWTDSRCSHLFQGDCLKALARLPDQSIDCMITDPPAAICQERPQTLRQTPAAPNAEAYELLDKALSTAWHKLKENSHIYIFANWQTFAPVAEVVKRYFNLKNALVWVKNTRTEGDSKRNYGYRYELILYAHKGRRYLSGRRDANILYFDKVPAHCRQHPTEKPVALIEYLLAKSTNEGDLVLDMFMGAGTTGVAARRTNRRYIGIELEPAWFALASQQVKDTAA